MTADRKKIILIPLVLFIFFVIVASGYLLWSKKSPQKNAEKENIAATRFPGESFQSKLEGGQETAKDQIGENTETGEINKENSNNNAAVEQDNLGSDHETTSTDQDEEEIPSAEIFLTIVSRGAAVGSAEEIRTLLKREGYEKSQIGSEKGTNIDQALIFFREEKFRREAQAVREFLIQKENIFSELRLASTVEEKSADIVIMLGRFKPAPPN